MVNSDSDFEYEDTTYTKKKPKGTKKPSKPKGVSLNECISVFLSIIGHSCHNVTQSKAKQMVQIFLSEDIFAKFLDCHS